MSDYQDLREKVLVLETRVQELKDRIENPPQPGFWARVRSWDTVKNLAVVLGLPAGIYAAWSTIDTQLVSAREIERREQLKEAVEHVGELQGYNSRIFQFQAAQDAAAVFAIQQAERGRVERLTKDLLEFWESYHDEFTRSEKTTLVEALIGLGHTERALDVWTTIDQSEMDAIWQGDMDILKARILFAEGPVQDLSSARESFRDAMRHAEDLDRPVKQDTLIEKFVGVRLMNELWVGTDCDDLAVFAEYLGEKLADEPLPDGIDPVRDNTIDVMDAYAMRCAE